jgi:hypothetical protein
MQLAMNPMSSEEIDRLARKRAGAKLGWYLHAAVYVLVNGFLLASSYYGFRMRPYNLYPALGWGLGLALHFVSVFLLGQGGGLREHMVRKERERLLREQNRQ